MKFGELNIGDFFVHGTAYTSVGIFRKKSLSSAYVCDPETVEPTIHPRYARYDKTGSFCGFSVACVVHKLERAL